MNCFFCKGNLIDGYTTHVVDLENCIIIIKNVPCQKCDQCGEVVLKGTIISQIEIVVDSLKNSLAEVVIVNYSDKVA